MTLFTQTHGGTARTASPRRRSEVVAEALVPADGDVAVDESADFGYLFPPSDDHSCYLADDIVGLLDELGELMVPEAGPPSSPGDPGATPDSNLPAVLTYWGQFLDHELTARTDRESEISKIETATPLKTAAEIEKLLKNARTPRFDLDSVYGGLPVGENLSADVATVIAGMRHPVHRAKMRVGTALPQGPMPDGLDPHRDLPRFAQVEQKVRDAYLNIARNRLSPADFAEFEAKLPKRAIIGDMRNDENLIVAQFHLSFLRFHNRVVDFLEANDTGWIPDFHSAQALTRLHYQWLIVEGYLKSLCDPEVVTRVLDEKARHFFAFRDAYYARNPIRRLGNCIPLEFSVAAYRFGHTMVRNTYDYNVNFGRPGNILPDASFELLFAFTGGGGLGPGDGNPKLPDNWIIDWSRFLTANPDSSDGVAARVARAIDTQLAPPLGDMIKEGAPHPEGSQLFRLFRHLAKRNLRRGLSLRLPTGQALHAHLQSTGAITSGPIANIADALNNNPQLKAFLDGSSGGLNRKTPLWFYLLAEAEAAGGNRLGELGSWIVASTFIGILLADPDSALSLDFAPSHSPLRMPDGSTIDSIEKWMRFALVME